MDHVAIDLGGKESQICIRRSDGAILREARVSTSSLPKVLSKLSPSRVVLETCGEAFWVADAAKEHGHEVRVVPASLVKALGVGSHGVKSDQRDARNLSEASCRMELPSVHIPSEASREQRRLLGMRDALVKARTSLCNQVQGWLRTKGWSTQKSAPESLPKRLREKADKRKTPLPGYVERELRMIEQLTIEVKGADKEITAAAKADATCRRLMTVPGIGPHNALRFFATLDDRARFPGAHQVESYLGLTPKEHSSSEKQHRGRITKAGPAPMRRLLGQAAWSAWRCRPRDPMVLWAKQVASRRGTMMGITALSRKLAGIMFAIWRDGTTYDAEKGAATNDTAAATRTLEEGLKLLTAQRKK